MGNERDLDAISAVLAAAGCVAAEDEAAELIEIAAGDPDRLDALVARRCQGEPLAWLTGSVRFCGERVLVHRGVFVPRWQTEPLALAAVQRLPALGIAIDLCTGAGAVAVVLGRHRPDAQVLATEIDPVAVACAEANGVDVREGDLTAPIAAEMSGRVDVVTAVVPYVPTEQLGLLPRDVLAYEPRHALDGGADGVLLLARAVIESAALLREGGSLLLELGGDQADLLAPLLSESGYRDREVLLDEDGDVRGIVVRRGEATDIGGAG